MTGTPMIGVMALMGMAPVDGNTLSQTHSKATPAPVKAVAGIRTPWREVPTHNRAICGTIRPMNPMGPQKAVAAAVRPPDSNNRMLRA